MSHLKNIFFLLFFLVLFMGSLALAEKKPVVHIPKIEPGKPLPANLFVQIAKKINPSVVNIATTVKTRARSHFLFPGNFGPRMSPLPAQSLGSGFIIEEDGHIVTNAHVVSKASVIKVHIKEDPTVYKARVVGHDPSTDIALIKISAGESRTRKKFPKAVLGDSNALQVGEWVAAFGNPYGHSNTMTKGIISAIDRHIDELNLLPFLQTDAGINPGNSGGPLVNTQGQVIGVNTAINPRAQNIGFAIPIYNVRSILKSLKKYGYVKRGFLGVHMSNVPVEFDYNKKTYQGVLIVDVMKGGPAQRAGIRSQDIITEFNGSPIKTSKNLFDIVSATPKGEKVRGKLFRDFAMRSFTAVVSERPRAQAPAEVRMDPPPKKSLSSQAPFRLGFTLEPSSQRLPHLPSNYASRPLVTSIAAKSPAWKAGLKAGDVIFSVNSYSVLTVEQAFKRLSSKGQNVLHVLRFNQPGSYNLKKIVLVQ